MLISLKNKRHKIVSVTLPLFVGSWLLLLCQTCFAANNEIRAHNQPLAAITDSCHAPLPVDTALEATHAHCSGVCDCDDNIVTLNTEKSADASGKIKHASDSYTYVVSQITLSNRSPPAYHIYNTPERAIFLPWQHYAVLLI